MLARIDAISADIAAVEAKIEQQIAPFEAAVDRLDEIPGVGRGRRAGDHRRDRHGHGPLPHPGASGLLGPLRARGQGIGRARRRARPATGHGNPYLARALGEAAVAAGRTNTFLGERYRRIARRRGKKRAIVAVGRSILIIVWHLLSDPEVRFHDLGPGFYDTRIDADRKRRNHIRQLEALGYRVTLQPAA